MNTRHWNWIQGLALAALLPLFAACSSEGDELLQSEEKQPVQVNITRAATDGNDWSWQNNDQIGLNITNYGESTPNSYTLTYNNNVWTSSPATIEATLPATIQAWWPNTNNASENNFDFIYTNNTYGLYNQQVWIEGTVDQQSEESLAVCDWMTCNTSLTSPTLDINMAHRLCKVTVTIKSYEGWQEGHTPAITNPRFFTIAGINNNNHYREVIPLTTTTEGKITYTAIIIPYYYTGLTPSFYPPFLKLTVDDTDQLVVLPFDFALNFKESGAGKAYTFNLTVKNPNAITRSTDTPEYELELVDVEDMNKN